MKQDIEVALLCSSIEAMTNTASYVIFKDWLVKDKLEDLSMKEAREIQSILNRAYEEYVNTEPNREGAFYNFRKFLTDYCPKSLRGGPMKTYDEKNKHFRQAIFEECITYAYAKFRSLFIHRGIGRATFNPPQGSEDSIWIGAPLLDKYGGKYYRPDILKFPRWFENVVKESLLVYFTS